MTLLPCAFSSLEILFLAQQQGTAGSGHHHRNGHNNDIITCERRIVGRDSFSAFIAFTAGRCLVGQGVAAIGVNGDIHKILLQD